MVIIVFGLPGTGKTKFAEKLSQYLQFDFLNTAAVRSKWISSPTFSLKEKQAVYLNLLQEMSEHMIEDRHIVLEGSFYLRQIRRDFHDVARILHKDLHWVEIVSDHYNSRLSHFRHDPAIADKFSVYRKLFNLFEPMDSDHLVLEYNPDSKLNELIAITLKKIPGLAENIKYNAKWTIKK
jgi:predicted kinase